MTTTMSRRGTCWSNSTRSRTAFKLPSRKPPWKRQKRTWQSAQAQVRGQVAQARANRYKLEHAIEDVDNQIANLHASVATLDSRKATLQLARANLTRGEKLFAEQDHQSRRARSAKGIVQGCGSGRRTSPPGGLRDPRQPRPACRASQGPRPERSAARAGPELLHRSAGIGRIAPERGPVWLLPEPRGRRRQKRPSPDFYKQDPQGDLNRIYARLIPQAPAIKQAEAKLLQAQRDLDEAELNLRYCASSAKSTAW